MISVAMAVYNGEKYIDEQIKSILCQLSEQDELVISYDNSTDKTLEKIKGWENKDKRIKVIINNNPGITNNFNNALSKCEGDIILISDQDDIWANNKIEVVSKEILDCDAIFHNFSAIDGDGKVLFDSFYENNVVNTSKFRTFWTPRQSGCCMAFKKSFLKRFLPIPLIVESYDHWLAMVSVKYGKVKVINEPLIFHRYHGSNVTTKTRRNVFAIFKNRFSLYKALKDYKRNHGK